MFAGSLPSPIVEDKILYPVVKIPQTSLDYLKNYLDKNVEILNSNNKMKSNSAWEIPGMFWNDREKARVQKLLQINEPTILDLFQKLYIANVPNYVNRAIYNWGILPPYWSFTGKNKRPIELLFFVPSSEHVLKIQSSGVRLVSIFVEKDALDATYKDPYPPYQVLRFFKLIKN